MKIVTETNRLILRHFEEGDAEGFFEMDSNPNVMRYIGASPLTDIEETRAIIKRIKQEYIDTGVGRIAAVIKETNELIGWAGLKYITFPVNGKVNFYELGYRFRERYWGKGYGSEAAQASIDYGFGELKVPQINAFAMKDNAASRHILTKVGMTYLKDFYYEGHLCCWFEMKREDWM